MTLRVDKKCENCGHDKTGRGRGKGHFVYGPCKDMYCGCRKFQEPEA